MKISLIFAQFLFAINIAISFPANAQAGGQESANSLTNTYLLSQNDVRDFSDQYQSELGYYMRSSLNHVVMPETLPADLDTNDLWGPPTNGFQLSLRFRNKEYSVGDILPAISILRNLKFQPQTVLLTNSSSFCLVYRVQLGTNGFLPERKQPIQKRIDDYSSIPSPPRGLINWPWEPRSEKELVLNLNRYFDFDQPGEYSVRAICRVYSPLTKTPVYEISSGVASFRLVEK